MESDSDEVFLSSARVKARYGVSAMWLHRRSVDASNFPTPIVIRGRKYWRLSELTKWELARARHEGSRAAVTA